MRAAMGNAAGKTGSAPPYATAFAFGRQRPKIAADGVFRYGEFDGEISGDERLARRQTAGQFVATGEWEIGVHACSIPCTNKNVNVHERAFPNSLSRSKHLRGDLSMRPRAKYQHAAERPETRQDRERILKVTALPREHSDERGPDETPDEIAERTDDGSRDDRIGGRQSSVTYVKMSGRNISRKKPMAVNNDIRNTSDVAGTLAAASNNTLARMIGTPACSRRS